MYDPILRAAGQAQAASQAPANMTKETEMSKIPHYEAETCLTGGYLCGHHHRTRRAAERCLPACPRSPSGSTTTHFSVAGVVARNDAAVKADARDAERERERMFG